MRSGDHVTASSGVVPPEKMLEPPMTRNRTKVSSSSFIEAHFYQYLDDHFSCHNLRLDAIHELQDQHAQDQHELLHQQMEFDRR